MFHRLFYDGRVLAYRFGRAVRYERGDLDEFIDGARVLPGVLDHLVAAAGPVDGRDHRGRAPR